MMTINELEKLIMVQAKEKGFGTNSEEINVAAKFALIHSEVSEAYEAYRRNNFEADDCLKEELADVIIRTVHLAGVFGIDLEEEIDKKIKKNNNRVWDWENLNEKHS